MKAVSTWTPVDMGGQSINTTGNLLTLGVLIILGVIAFVAGLRFIPRRREW